MTEVKYLDLTGLQRYDQKIKEVVNTGLDTKIGKDDVMLGSEDLLSSWEGNDVPETPYMTNNWSAHVESKSYVLGYTSTTIYNENNEVIFELPSSEELDVANFPVLGYTYTHNNGNLSILVELMDAPENYTANIQINPTSAYKLVFGEDVYHVRLTGDIYTEFPTNTKKSFEKLNKSIVRFDSKIRELEENKVDQTSFGQHVQEFDELKGDVRDIESSLALKADKTEVESSLALKADKTEVESAISGINAALDAKISKTQSMLSVYRKESSETYNYDGGFSEILIGDKTQITIQKDAESGHDVFLTNNGGIIASYTAINNITFTRNGIEVSITGLYLNGSTISDIRIIDSSSPCGIEQGEYVGGTTVIINKLAGDVELNTQESLNYLSENKADKAEVALKADKSEVAQKIGKDDAMLVAESSNTVSAYLDGSNFVEVSDESWHVKITPGDHALDYKFSIIDGENVIEKYAVDLDVYRNRPEDGLGANYIKIKYFSYSTGKNEEIIEVTNDTLKFGCEIDGNVEITSFANNLTRNTKESFEYLNNTLSTKITAEDLPTAVSQLTNDAGYAVAGDLKITEVTEELGENVAKAYKFEGGAESAVIEIPKDQTLKSVELGKIVDETFVVDPTGEILRFTYIIADGSESVVDVNISNLITEAELDPVYAAINEKVAAADIVKVTNEEIDAMFA